MLAGTNSIIMELGSNSDAITPPPDPAVSVLVFEPLFAVAAQIEEVDRRHVVAAAVSDQTGLSVLTMYNDNGLSSSLATVSVNEQWNDVLKSRIVRSSEMMWFNYSFI